MTQDTQSYKTNMASIRAASVICALMAVTSLFWAVRSDQPRGLIVSFSCAAACVPILYLVAKRYIDKHLREQDDDAVVYRDLLNQVNDAIIVTSVAEPYRILEGNRFACERLGYDKEELLKLNAGDITDLGDAESMLGFSRGRRASSQAYREINYITKDKRNIPVEVSARLIRLRGQRALLVVGRDLSERKQMEDRIRYMAYYDDLTGLPNRRLFRERLNVAMGKTRDGGGGLAVFYLDIDRFKLVNDSFGHDYGDMILMQLAECFTRCVGEEDFLARTEGDEFAVFYSNINSTDQLSVLADGIRETLEQPFMIGEYHIHITVSVGIAHYMGEPGVEADVMMKNADIALSRSKENGRNTHQIFNSEMNSISLKRLTLESQLRRAIVNHEFMLEYQPQINIQDGTFVGMEALIRWKHPDRGMVSPGEFIPVAEETGLIVPIGEWVIEEACRQNKEWQDSGFIAVPISVNLSMRQFLQHNLKGKIEAILERTGLSPQYLDLEITESMTMDVEFATNSLLELKELGVQISIDDFGTGYSSLNLLKKFPIDKLKIDRSFVRDIMVDPNDAAIVTTIISMTQHLNLKVIAEGVETEEQMRFLQRNQCHQIQGFWFSPPIPAGQMGDMMSLNRGNHSA